MEFIFKLIKNGFELIKCSIAFPSKSIAGCWIDYVIKEGDK